MPSKKEKILAKAKPGKAKPGRVKPGRGHSEEKAPMRHMGLCRK
jgi:hypothetical protein